MKKLVVVLMSLVLFTGGCSMTNETNNGSVQYSLEERSKIIKEQDRMVSYLYSSYQNIKKIEFTSFDKNISTDTWTANAIVNDVIYVTFGVYSIEGDAEISFGQHISQSGGQKLTRKTTISNDFSSNNVEVIYFNGGSK